MPLSPSDMLNAIPEDSPYKLPDGKGLYLEVRPIGGKFWKFRYRYGGRDRKLWLGDFPEVSLEAARARRDAARATLATCRDTVAEHMQQRLEIRRPAGSTFRDVADEYIEKMEAEERSPLTLKKLCWFRDLVDREMGRTQIDERHPMQLLDALRRIERRGHRETAGRVRSFVSRVGRYAIATARSTVDPADALRGALITPKVRHLSAITILPGSGADAGDRQLYGTSRNDDRAAARAACLCPARRAAKG